MHSVWESTKQAQFDRIKEMAHCNDASAVIVADAHDVTYFNP